MSESYDSLIRRAVPDYAEIIDTLVGYLPAAASRVVELGCGTGNLSLRLAGKYPDATLTIVDASADMVALTEARLRATCPDVADRARFIVSRFEEVELGEGAHDLVTSSFSLHHVRDKRSLFARMRRSLVDGGWFRFADQMRGASDDVRARDWDAWIAFCRLPGHCSEKELAELIAHSHAHDHYETIGDTFAWLRSSGFGEVDCLWRRGMWSIFSAVARVA